MTTVAVRPIDDSPRSLWLARPGLHLAAACVLTALAIASTWPVWAGIFRYAARNEEQSHSFFAIPVAIWLVWVRRASFNGLTLSWGLAGPAVMAAGWAFASIGFHAGIETARNVGALIVVIGALYTGVGRDAFLRFLPAIGALLLVLPVPGRIRLEVARPLQEWSALIAQFILDLIGVATSRSGNVLTINGVEVGIAEACNGMRMVSALAVVAYAFAFSARLRPGVRLGILLASPLIALVVNVVRLVPTVVVYGNASVSTAEAFHDAGGWAALLVAIGIMVGITALLRWLEIPIDQPSIDHASTPNLQPVIAAFRTTQASLFTRAWIPVAAFGIALSMLTVGGFDAQRTIGADGYFGRVRDAVAAIPYQIGGAIGSDSPVSPGVIRILRPNAVVERQYRNPDPALADAFGLVMVHCSDTRDLEGHYPPKCYPSSGWTPRGVEARSFTAAGLGAPATVYRFTRASDLGEAATTVVSFFVLPGASGIVDDMDAVARASRSTTAAALGGAHVMVSFVGLPEEARVDRTVRSVLEQLAPAIRAVEQGVGVD